MKTKATKIRTMIGLFTTLAVMMVLAVAAAPAMAGPPHLDSSVMHDVLGIHEDLDGMHEIIDSLIDTGVIPGLIDEIVPDEGPFPEGSDWEPHFPDTDDGTDEGDDAGDEGDGDSDDDAEDDEDAGDEACEEEVADDGDDEVVDESTEETMEEEPLEEETDDGEEATELPYTGGDSIPWLIGGAGVILAGLILLFGLRGRNQNR